MHKYFFTLIFSVFFIVGQVSEVAAQYEDSRSRDDARDPRGSGDMRDSRSRDDVRDPRGSGDMRDSRSRDDARDPRGSGDMRDPRIQNNQVSEDRPWRAVLKRCREMKKAGPLTPSMKQECKAARKLKKDSKQ